jgi:hypothetical protein
MTETDDGYCAVEVGADTPQAKSTQAENTQPTAPGDGIAWDLAASGDPERPPQNPNSETPDPAVDVTEYDVVLPEVDMPHADHPTPKPHAGLFSRLRRAAGRASHDVQTD